jgi:Ca2+-binding EF-hand superfamily protein
MNRVILATALAATSFIALAATAQTGPAPQTGPARVETRDEAMAKADARFDRMDANKDGKLSPAEMRPVPPPPPADGAAPPTPPPPPAGPGMAGPRMGERMFARMDTNGDGFVDRTEARAMAARRFDRIDANKDGKIDQSERDAARDAMGDRMGQMRGKRGPGAGGDMPPPPPPPPAPDPNAGQ